MVAVVPISDPDPALAYRPLALAMARREARHFARLAHDLRGEAQLGLVQAARRRPTATAPYLRTCIAGAIKDFRRRLIPRGYREKVQRPDGRWPRTLNAGHCRPIRRPIEHRDFADLDGADWVEWACGLLDESHGAVIWLLYVGGLDAIDAADHLGLDFYAVDQLHREALMVLRGRLGGPNFNAYAGSTPSA